MIAVILALSKHALDYATKLIFQPNHGIRVAHGGVYTVLLS